MRFLPLFIIWCLWFVNFSSRTTLSPILPLIEENLSLSHGMAGALFTSLSLGYSLSLLVIGRFVSLLGYKRIAVLGFIGISLTFLGFQWAETYLAFHSLFFLLGMATGTYLPSVLPILTATYESRVWGRVIGFHETAAGLSIFSAPILVAFGLTFFSWRHLLLFLAIAALLLPLFFWRISLEPKGERSPQGSGYLDLFKKKSTWVMILLWILSSANGLGIYSVLPLYLIKERGIDFRLANTLFGVSRVGGIFVPIFIGLLVDRYGYRMMLMLSLFAMGLVMVGLSLASALPLILTILTLQGILSICFFPVALTALSKLTSVSERPMVLGVIISIGVILGMGGAPFLLGIVADYLSFKVGILGLGILTLLSSLSVTLLRREA